jgi:hypothetical protein
MVYHQNWKLQKKKSSNSWSVRGAFPTSVLRFLNMGFIEYTGQRKNRVISSCRRMPNGRHRA